MNFRGGFLFGLIVALGGAISWANEPFGQSYGQPNDRPYGEPNGQPYIDQLLQEIHGSKSPRDNKDSQSGNSTYLEGIQTRLKSETSQSPPGSFIEDLKATDALRDEAGKSESYSEKERIRLETKSTTGAIQAVHEGKSELEFKRPGSIHHAMGLRYSVSINREIGGTSVAQAFDFQNIYGGSYAPEFAIFYEYQPFHSEWFGNVGIVGSVGVNYFYGVGQYAIQVPKPGGTGFFPANSAQKLQFFAVPIMVALNYRFNLFRILRPYVMLGPTLIGYLESRNDSVASNRGHSQGFTTSLGVSILMDWLSRGSSWNLYEDFAVKHYYLTLDYTQLVPLTGDVSFAFRGVSAGLTFEY
jgi:hypothetical protein